MSASNPVSTKRSPLAAQPAGSRGEGPPEAALRPPRALLAEDDPTQRLILHECVAGAGFEVIDASDGAEALELANTVEPDVILLDIVMPKMTGFEVCAAVRRNDRLSSVPILIMTGLDDEASIARAFEVGATDFLTKPINWRLIHHRLKFIARIGLMERELRASKEQSDAANIAKANFIANMSHELRTPLNAIIGFSDVILSEVFGPIGNPSYKEYLVDIKKSGKHLLDLISDILEWSKLEAGASRFRYEEIKLRDLVEQCSRMITPIAESRGIAVNARADDLALSLDVRATKQILINLLSNAVKFSVDGGTVEIAGSRGKDGFAVIEVSDSGVGIPADKISEVTRPFYQVDDGLSRTHEGTGLGLAIASQLLALLGGRLEIESRIGEGTRVAVHLPLEPKTAAA
ncbi:MAG: response regulator [Alphaproteobacteria bacterium]